MSDIQIGSGGYGNPVTQKVMRGSVEVDKVYVGANIAYTKNSGGGGGGGSAYSISLVSDDSGGGYSYKAVIQLTTLPSGATGYKVEMTGTEDNSDNYGNPQAYTGVVVYIPSPVDNTTYQANQGSPSTAGPQNTNNTVKYIDSTKRIEIRQESDNGMSSGSVTVTPIDTSNSTVGSASNTITGIEITEVP
jgi:hypothetical protein